VSSRLGEEIPFRRPDLDGSARWLRCALTNRNMSLHPSSDLARELDHLEKFVELSETNGVLPVDTVDDAVGFLYPAWAADFLTKLLHRGSAFQIAGFDEMLKHVASAKPLPTSPVRAERLEPGELPTDQPKGGWRSRNLTWELAIACAVATFASDVALAEPDVTCVFEGRRVGLAAKAIYSSLPKRLEDRVVEGAKQIEDADVDEGHLVLNLAERYPAAALVRRFREAGELSPDQYIEIIDGWAAAFVSTHNMADLARRLRGSSKLLSIISLIPGLVPSHETLIPMYRISCTQIDDRIEKARPFQYALNGAFQDVHRFEPTDSKGGTST
jgi:hypothetical protein